jgi:uncharacterized SAM-binding protein YcdF (DUF218 family)
MTAGGSRFLTAARVNSPWIKAFFLEMAPRGTALFIGVFSLLNICGQLRSAHFDANLWWIDLRTLPASIAGGFLLGASCCLTAYALGLTRPGWLRVATVFFAAGLLGASLLNAISFYLILAANRVSAGLPLPVSLLVTLAMTLVIVSVVRNRTMEMTWLRRLEVGTVFAACIILFPLVQMLCFGKTDYRRTADVAVVFGARVYADGRPSDALADRVRTACELHRQKLARKLLLSGGPGDGAIHETTTMKNMAMRLGVKAEDIVIDTEGRNTEATVRNSAPVFQQLHAGRILVVSHFYHLPRIKLAYQRHGYEVYTVPARESYLLRQMPFFMAREVAALWVYYLRPLAGSSQGSA